jgi:hypothetical protein
MWHLIKHLQGTTAAAAAHWLAAQGDIEQLQQRTVAQHHSAQVQRVKLGSVPTSST